VTPASDVERSAAAPRPDHAFGQKAGEAWVRLQEQTDTQLDPLGLAAMSKLALSQGSRVLDVGCGCGQTLLELAEIVGPRGRVIGVDISEPMLERARHRATDHAEIEVHCADAQSYPFAPADVDAIFSRFGVMFFDDARRAFANLRPVLRPRGRLAFVCWQELALNPWADLPLRAVMRVLGRDVPPDLFRPGYPGPFSFSDPDLVRTILADAGFIDIEIERLDGPLHVGGAMNIEQAIAYWFQIGPAARAMVDAPANLHPALEAALAGVLERATIGERGVWMDAAAFVVTAHV
jgi:ubiquinone/menaquinone biosynthesis C-methylase UbiE